MFVRGGRARVCVNDISFISSMNLLYFDNSQGRLLYGSIRDINENAWQKLNQLTKIFGSVRITRNTAEQTFIINGKSQFSYSYQPYVENFDIYQEFGFVEGVARINTPVGDAACIVKNGVLYPVITEFDNEIDDHWTLPNVWLNGDYEVANLQQMVDKPGQYLAYDEAEAESHWSPVENYLHQHVNMPIVPKVGYIPPTEIGVGTQLPGLNYVVAL